jgi:hypothetical protein
MKKQKLKKIEKIGKNEKRISCRVKYDLRLYYIAG